jgi:hypothetical protein
MLILYIFWNNAFEPFSIQGFVALLNVELNKARRFFLPILYGFECHMARLAQSKLMRVLWKCWFVYYFYRIALMAFYITRWSLRPIIASSFVSLGFPGFGMLTCLVGLNGYFVVRNHFAVCSNHLQLMPRKKRFPSLPPPGRSFVRLGIMFLSLDLICLYAIMNACGSAIMLVIFWDFLSALGFSFQIQLVAVLTRTREARLF